VGKTLTLHLHLGLFGSSKKAPVCTLDLVPALAALNKSTHHEYEVWSRCGGRPIFLFKTQKKKKEFV